MRFRLLCCALLRAAGTSQLLSAQQPGDTTTPAQLVNRLVDDSARVALPRNVHPLARPDFNHGEPSADLSLGRMLAVLKRSH